MANHDSNLYINWEDMKLYNYEELLLMIEAVDCKEDLNQIYSYFMPNLKKYSLNEAESIINALSILRMLFFDSKG